VVSTITGHRSLYVTGDFKIKMRYYDVKKNANEYYYRDRKVTIDLLV